MIWVFASFCIILHFHNLIGSLLKRYMFDLYLLFILNAFLPLHWSSLSTLLLHPPIYPDIVLLYLRYLK